MAIKITSKRLQIDKANTTVVIVVSIAAFVTVFSLFASKALLSRKAYQARVITAKTHANNILVDDIKASDSLVSSYEDFVKQSPNVLGGSIAQDASGEKDGDNARIVLDALPSQYDFPALTTSIEKILVKGGYKINGITGNDDSVAQAAAKVTAPVAIPIPISVSAESNYASIQNLIIVFEKSIRPFQVQTIDFTGNDTDIKAEIAMQTFYQPGQGLTEKSKVIK
ncbi:MAG: hypothetical protein NVSMB46_00900 [Candidatus Saccharimonadales bacterium]